MFENYLTIFLLAIILLLIRKLYGLVPPDQAVKEVGLKPKDTYTLRTDAKNAFQIRLTVSGRELASLLAFLERRREV